MSLGASSLATSIPVPRQSETPLQSPVPSATIATIGSSGASLAGEDVDGSDADPDRQKW